MWAPSGYSDCEPRPARCTPSTPTSTVHDVVSGVRAGEAAKGQAEGQDTGLPCLSQITFFCDLLLLYVDGEAHFYWSTKYEEVSCEPVQTRGSISLCTVLTRALF